MITPIIPVSLNEGCSSLARKVEDTANTEKKSLGEGGSYRKKKRKLGDVVSYK